MTSNDKGKHKPPDARRKLSDDQLARIVELHRKGVTQTAIAERMGVTRSAVGFVLKRMVPKYTGGERNG